MGEIYLDNSATTKPFDKVIDIMLNYYKNNYGNPSSLHKMGIDAEKGIKKARNNISKILNVEDSEVIFTSGGTEGNNIAILGLLNRNKRRGNHIITTLVEHPSVLNTFKNLEKTGYEVTYLGVNSEGKVETEDIETAIRKDTVLISIMLVNNEVGTIQPIKEISKIIKNKNSNCFFHVDGVQAFGKIKIHPKELGIDLLTISSHKIHGPKGIGALYINKKVLMEPLLFGGGQEYGLRSGTENVPGIVGMGLAVEIINENFHNHIKHLSYLREKTKKAIIDNIDNIKINGPQDADKIAPHILNVSFENIKGEILLHSLEQNDIYISTGAACSSKKNIQSHVLKNMGLTNTMIDGAMRISFSIFNTDQEIDIFIETLKNQVNMLRNIIRG